MNLMTPKSGSDDAASEHAIQFGALCYRMHRGKVQVLLITSRDTGRWVIPKGWPMTGKTGAETARQEAWEEAGVNGTVDASGLGSYAYSKRLPRRGDLPCSVQVFALRVEALEADFPERSQRQRKWFSATKAARKVDEPELRQLLLDFDGSDEATKASLVAD